MDTFSVRDMKPLNRLKAIYGDEIMLEGYGKEETAFRIMAEFVLGDRQYAVLQSEAQRKEDEVELFRIVDGNDGQPQLESIEDDDEWDDVVELYDESTFDFDKDDD